MSLISIEYYVVCEKCGCDLETDIDDRTHEIKVSPCSDCTNELEDEIEYLKEETESLNEQLANRESEIDELGDEVRTLREIIEDYSDEEEV